MPKNRDLYKDFVTKKICLDFERDFLALFKNLLLNLPRNSK